MKAALQRLNEAIGRLEAVTKALQGTVALASSTTPEYTEQAWKEAQEAADKYVRRRAAELAGHGRHVEPAD